MSAIEWHEIEEVFQAALEVSPAERDAWLARHCGTAHELRREVESLLAAESASVNFLSPSDLPKAASILLSDQTEHVLTGQHIGPFKILRELGHGGMGVVYLGVRDQNQFRQTVAIKLIRRGLDTDDILRRFRNERQILASLNHPNIAKLFEGGTNDDGLPYFVMEYIQGRQLLQYCDENAVSVTDRLKLFRSVCAAVQHAHQNLIIHRDLKPSNILVTAAGEVKLLDFGVAKILNPDLTDGALTQTQAVVRMMTPEYASPEQVRGQHVTTATDIYSLGVILYELLTGTKPYKLKDTSPEELSRAICDAEPSKPSQAVTGQSSVVSGKAVSDTGQPEIDQQLTTNNRPRTSLNPKLLRGDLDNIILMALRKDPVRRYESVEQFSEDIRRHLDGLPVIAAKDSFSYRTGKLIKRHKVGVAAILVIVLALLGGVSATLWQARTARRERDKEQYINTFLQDMLGAAAPDARGTDVKVVDVLNEASKRAKIELAEKPEILADVLLTLGKTYIGLGQYGQAEANLRPALDASLKANGELHATTANSMGWLGLALAQQNKLADGEQISRRAVELQRKLHPGGNEDLAVALYALGYNLIGKDEPKAAQPVLQEASELIKKHLGETNGYYMATLGMLGSAHEKAGETDAAEALYRQAIDVGGRVEPRYRIYLAQAQALLGILLLNKAAYPEAENLLKQSETTYRDVMGGDANYSVGTVKAYLGLLYFRKSDYARAEDEDRTALDLLRRYLGPESPLTIGTAATLGLTLTREGKSAAGEQYLRGALETRKKVLAPSDVSISLTESSLGECLTAQKRYAEAEPLLLKGYAGLKDSQGEKDSRTLEALKRLVTLYRDWKKPDKAAQFSAMLSH